MSTMRKNIIAFLVALLFAASLLLPVGYILANIIHAHRCCSDEYTNTHYYSVTSICCIICINIHNAKTFIAMIAISAVTSLFLLFVYFFAYLFLKTALLFNGFSTPVSLNVRMNN